MAFFLTLVYLFLTLVPPAELHQSLAEANVMVVLGVAAISLGLLGALASGKRRRPPVQFWLVVALMLWAAVSVVLALRWLGGAFLTLQSMAVNFGMFWLLVLTVDTLRRLTIVRLVLLVTLGVLVVLGAWDLQTSSLGGRFVFVQGGGRPSEEGESVLGDAVPSEQGGHESAAPALTGEGTRRRLMALGYLADPNQLAQVLAAALPLFLVGWRHGRPTGNFITVVAPAALFAYGIVLTGSRGGLVALAAVLAAAALLYGRRWLSRLTMVACFVASPIALVVARQTARQDDSAAGRMEAWS